MLSDGELAVAVYLPEVAHGLQDLVIELDGPRDEQGGVWWLVRHVGFCVLLLGWACGEVSCRRVGKVVCRA